MDGLFFFSSSFRDGPSQRLQKLPLFITPSSFSFFFILIPVLLSLLLSTDEQQYDDGDTWGGTALPKRSVARWEKSLSGCERAGSTISTEERTRGEREGGSGILSSPFLSFPFLSVFFPFLLLGCAPPILEKILFAPRTEANAETTPALKRSFDWTCHPESVDRRVSSLLSGPLGRGRNRGRRGGVLRCCQSLRR